MVATPVVAENRYLDDSSNQLPERSVGRAYDRQGWGVVFDPGGHRVICSPQGRGCRSTPVGEADIDHLIASATAALEPARERFGSD